MGTAHRAGWLRCYDGHRLCEFAAQIGIKSASIHHHFPIKGNLGGTLPRRYTTDFAGLPSGLLTLECDHKPANLDACLRKYCDVFRTTLLNENRMCLGGILSAEYQELPAEVNVELGKFQR